MLKQIFYDQFADIRRDEWPKALLLSAFFFLVIATFWILKPLKRGVIINYFGEDPLRFIGFVFEGAEAEQVGKVLNVAAVYLVVVGFTWLVRHVPRHVLVAVFAAVFSGAFVLYAFAMDALNDAVVWSFYVFGDMFNTIMVVLFWAFTNDIVTSDEAKRTYGIIGLGGVVGGFVGATVVNTSVEAYGRDTLLFACIIPMVLIAGIAFAVHRMAKREGRETDGPAAAGESASAAWEGAKLVFQSRYLLGIAGLIAVYELTSNVIDFQLASTVERAITEDLEKDAFFALVGQLIGVGSIVVQLFLTAFVMKRFGLKVALAFLPVAILLASTGFLVFPILAFAAAMSVSDNALNYSINQSAKEALYTPTTKDETYKAKAFIDMFLQRFAKVISAVLNLAFVAFVAEGMRWLTLVTLSMLAGWLWLVRFLGRRFREREEAPDEALEEAAGPA